MQRAGRRTVCFAHVPPQWPEKRTLYDYVWDREENRFMDWLDTIPEFKIAPESQYHRQGWPGLPKPWV